MLGAVGIEPGDVGGGDVASHVHAVKTRGVKALDGRVERADGALHGVHVLVDQGVAADDLANLLHRAVVRHQLMAGGHVDAVHVGVAHRRRGAGHVDLAGAGIARHLHNLAAGGAAHDGVVHQQHVAALELAGDHVELLPHRFFAHRLPRHDEGAPHVAVFNEALAVGQTQQLCQLCGAGAAGFGDGDHHVNLARRHGGNHPLGQGLAQVQPRLVHRDAVHHRVRPGQVDKLKNAGVQHRVLGALLRVHGAVQVNEYGLTRRHIALEAVRGTLQGHRFTGHHHRALAAPQAQGPDAKGVAKRQHAVPGNQGNHGIRAAHAPVHLAHSVKHIGRLQRQAARGFVDFVRQHVQQHLRIALGVDVPVVGAEQLGLERLGIGEVAVVHQHDAKGRVHVKRLGFFLAVGVASGGVAHLAQAAVARQRAHVAGAEHITHHAFGLVHEELALLLGHDAGRVLAPVLQQQQGVIDQLINRGVADNTNNSTHKFPIRPGHAFAAASGQVLSKFLRQQGLEALDRCASDTRAH